MSKSVYFLVEKMIDILNMYVWKYNGGKKGGKTQNGIMKVMSCTTKHP